MSTLTCQKRIVLKRSMPYKPLVEPLKINNKKSVRFNDQRLEQVVYFHKTQPPRAIQEQGLISANDYTISLPNWPSLFDQENKVRMENVRLTDGDYEQVKKNRFVMEGRCRALNISYQKVVSVRYTFDLWRSYEETTGLFKEPIPSTSNTWDRFSFSIPIEAKKVGQTLYLALRYSVNGQEYWDNNNGLNYKITITPPNTISPKKVPKPLLSKRYDFTTSLSPPPSPPITPPIEYTPPVFIQNQDNLLPDMSYTDFVNKYCFYNSHSTPIYNTLFT